MPILQEKLSTIVLAAGVGKRMKSKTPKILHRILGKPIISFVLDLARDIGSAQTVLVINNTRHDVFDSLGHKMTYAVQAEPLGSGDAARKGLEKAASESVLILCGDVPLLRKETVAQLIEYHRKKDADLTILTCLIRNPFGYGRIIRGTGNCVKAIIEQTDATVQQQKIKEINAGVYFGDKELLIRALDQITNDNEQGEYYLTDAIRNIAAAQKRVCGYMIDDETEIIGVNSRAQLSQVREIVKREWFARLMANGVGIEDPATTNIDLSVVIGNYVHIRPYTLIEGDTTISDGQTIGPFAWIKDGKRIALPDG